MNCRNILMGLTLCGAVALVVWSCNDQPEVPLQPPVVPPPGQVPPPMTPPGMPPTPGAQPPGMQPPATPPAAQPPTPVAEPELPRTELIPISDVEEDPDPKKTYKGGKEICKLPGPATPGDELLGNYKCKFNVKGLPFGLTPPAVGCAIRKSGEGKLSVIPTGRDAGAGAFRGPVSETKASGFRVQGKYKFSGNQLTIGACMRAKGVGKYKGSGSGVLNGDKKNRLKYTLTMTKL